MFRNSLSQTRHDHSVQELYFVVDLGMICSGSQVFSAQADNDCREERDQELRVAFGLQICQKPWHDGPVVKTVAALVDRLVNSMSILSSVYRSVMMMKCGWPDLVLINEYRMVMFTNLSQWASEKGC